MGIDMNGNMIPGITADTVTHKTTDVGVGGLVVDRVRCDVGSLCFRWHRCASCHWTVGTGCAAGRAGLPPRSSMVVATGSEVGLIIGVVELPMGGGRGRPGVRFGLSVLLGLADGHLS